MLLRRITQHVKDQNWFAVALDFLIVVAGILIAMQITNWNETRQDKAALKSYLTSMSNNIRSDIAALETLETNKIDLIARAQILTWTPPRNGIIDRTRLSLASETIGRLSDFEYFQSDRSGFDLLKGTGLLSYLQGQDVETMIYDYDRLAEEIARKEQDYNEILKGHVNDFSRQQFETLDYLMYPDLIATDEELLASQPRLRKIMQHPTTTRMYAHVFERAPELIVRYENLAILGAEINRIIESDFGYQQNSLRPSVEGVFEIDGTQGYPTIVRDGVSLGRFFEIGQASSSSDKIGVTYGIGELNLDVPTADWAVFYFQNRPNYLNERPARDFSAFSSMKITLRAGIEGRRVMVAMKDSTDPDDGSESRISFVLSDQWQTFEIPLSDFETTDLEDVFLPISFVFEGAAQNISIRDVSFVK